MNSSTAIKLLEDYATSVSGSEQTLSLVAARWIAAEPSAMNDDLLKQLFTRAKYQQEQERCAPRMFSRGGGSNILDYFHSGGVTAAKPTTPSRIEFDPIPQQQYQRHRIYCDGACHANGRRGARAGFGAILQSPSGSEIESVSEALAPSESQTNQRAELRALHWAFAKAMSLPEGADIYTDSDYAIKCFTEWGALWASKGWRKSGGGDVLHQDIIRPMWEIWKSRGLKIRLHHIAAHTGKQDRNSLGNERADALAVASIAGA